MIGRTTASTPKRKSNRPSQGRPPKSPKNKRRRPKRGKPSTMRGKNANQDRLLDSATLATSPYVGLLLANAPGLNLRSPTSRSKKALSNSKPVETYSQPRVSPKTFEKESMSVAQRQTLTTALTQPVMLKNTVDTNQAPRTLRTDTFLLALMDEIEKRSNTSVGADLVGGCQ